MAAVLALSGDVIVQATLGFLATVGSAFLAYLAMRAARGARTAATSADYQLTPNGGASVADAVRRMEATIDRIEERQMLTDRRVERLANQISPPHGTPTTVAEWATEPTGTTSKENP